MLNCFNFLMHIKVLIWAFFNGRAIMSFLSGPLLIWLNCVLSIFRSSRLCLVFLDLEDSFGFAPNGSFTRLWLFNRGKAITLALFLSREFSYWNKCIDRDVVSHGELRIRENRWNRVPLLRLLIKFTVGQGYELPIGWKLMSGPDA